jgi:cytoskeletal protein RodZ
MKIKTIGEILKSERERHQIPIAELARRTRIRPEYLEALEANRFSALPAAVFVKGYIKTYAQLFGFDSQPLLALLRRDFKESAVGTLVPRDFIKPILKNRQLWTPITYAILGFAVIFLTLVGYVGVQWYNVQKPPKLVLTAPQENDFVSQQIVIKGQTVSDAVVTVNAQPVALQPDGQFQTEVYIPREGIHTITVESADRRGKKSVLQRSVHVRF